MVDLKGTGPICGRPSARWRRRFTAGAGPIGHEGQPQIAEHQSPAHLQPAALQSRSEAEQQQTHQQPAHHGRSRRTTT